ncbi:MAG: S-methyl-5-thioribose-1-phosphate isomerase [Bacteroidota bacterium]
MNKKLNTLEYSDGHLVFLDQTLLPLKEKYISSDKVDVIARAIEKLEIRGAPAIGVAAAYALALSVKEIAEGTDISLISREFLSAYERLARTRPTAVNLFWALNEMKNAFGELQKNNTPASCYFAELLKKAVEIHQDDTEKCRKISEAGASLFEKPSVVLTHCNAGSLATAGEGTAVGVIKRAYKNGMVSFVYADETRPLFQGSRLTAFELHKAGIPFSVNTDSMAAWLMAQGKIDLVITGADRIAANGDAANKIGTYNLAVLCRYHKVPFYIAAPTSTVDKTCPEGKYISIEQRDKNEVIMYKDAFITSDDFDVYNPAFDVTPSELINAIITEEGVFRYPYKF